LIKSYDSNQLTTNKIQLTAAG